MFRRREDRLEVFLGHPGGPYFARKDEGVWTVPKGLVDPGEEPLQAACREFQEETGRAVSSCAPEPEFLELGSVVQRGGKRVIAWAFEGDWPQGRTIECNTITLEWPPRSGRTVEIPEIDRAEFFEIDTARAKINPAQVRFLDRLAERLE